MLNKKQLIEGFGKTGIKNGDTVVVHTSYKSLGGVEGGADTVIDAFVELAGRDGEFAKADDVEAYGPNSAFALFHKINGTIVSIGLDFNSTFSMHHYIEYNVGCNYRRVKEFSGIYVGYDRKPQVKMYSMFVRKDQTVKTYIVPGMNDLLAAGVIREVEVGAAKVHYSTANDFYDNMSVIVREHPEKLHYIEGARY